MKLEKRKELVDAFLIDLQTVCQKHNMSIGGCGCCNSPYIDLENKEIAGNLAIEANYYKVLINSTDEEDDNDDLFYPDDFIIEKGRRQ
jgi:hypothetical protein